VNRSGSLLTREEGKGGGRGHRSNDAYVVCLDRRVKFQHTRIRSIESRDPITGGARARARGAAIYPRSDRIARSSKSTRRGTLDTRRLQRIAEKVGITTPDARIREFRPLASRIEYFGGSRARVNERHPSFGDSYYIWSDLLDRSAPYN